MKILLVGGTNGVVDNLHDYLNKNNKVQNCEPLNSAINKMNRIIKPDIVIIVKNCEVDDSLYRNLSADLGNVQALTICNADDDCARLYKAENLHYMFKPITNEALSERICSITGMEVEDSVESESKSLTQGGDGSSTGEYDANSNISGNSETSFEASQIYETNTADLLQSGKKKILAIDDNALVLRGLKQLLNSQYEIALAKSVEEGIKLIEKKNFDLILLDYEMPETNGYTALQIFKTNHVTKDWPIVFLTGVADKKRISEVASLKPAGYLLKPINADRLMETIQGILD